MKKSNVLILLLISVCGATANAQEVFKKTGKQDSGTPTQEKEPGQEVQSMDASREFEFSYGATLLGLTSGAEVKVWVPIAETNPHQTVELKSSETPVPLVTNREQAHQNLIGSFHFPADGKTPARFNLVYDVTRIAATEYRQPSNSGDAGATKRRTQYLQSNRTVPITGKPIDLIKDMELPQDSIRKARKLYDIVFDHMAYDKSKPGYGNGDSVWACDSRTGNCTDFHSLFISLARNQSVASKFEIGFPIPADRESGKIGGYHCWAWFLSSEDNWVPVDISEADKNPKLKDRLFGFLPSDRVAFSTGRDIVLVPASAAGPKNFFVYPHVEVDGKIWPKEKIKLNFSFKAK